MEDKPKKHKHRWCEREMAKIAELEKLFGRPAREGYYLRSRNGCVFEQALPNSGVLSTLFLVPLLCFIGNGVEVDIRDSTIADAGKGLFLKKGINKDGSVSVDTMLAPYDGIRFESKKKGDKYIATQDGNDYIWKGKKGNGTLLVIDAKDPKSCYGRYANDALSARRNNAEIRIIGTQGTYRVALFATKTIRKGDEIFVAYGAEYWKTEPERTPYRVLKNAWRYYEISDPFPLVSLQESQVIHSENEPIIESLNESMSPQYINQSLLTTTISRKRNTEDLKKLLKGKKQSNPTPQEQPVIQTVIQPRVQSTPQPVIQPIVQPVVEPVVEPVIQTIPLPEVPLLDSVAVKRQRIENLQRLLFVKKRTVLFEQMAVIEIEEELRIAQATLFPENT